MQKLSMRVVFAAAPFALILMLTGCKPQPPGPDTDSTRVQLKVDTTEILRMKGRSILHFGFGHHAKKSKPVKIPTKPTVKTVSICVLSTFNTPVAQKYDSIVLEVFMTKNGHSTLFAHLTLYDKGFHAASVQMAEKEAFELTFTTLWYKDNKPAEEGNWCSQGDAGCVITPGSKCSDIFSNATTVQSTATGVNTTTVTVEEQ